MEQRAAENIITLEQHLMEEQQKRRDPDSSTLFSWLLSGIALASKVIAGKVRRGPMIDLFGAAGEVNVQGEEQQKLDVIADQTLQRALGYRSNVGIIASEENEEPVVIHDFREGGKYIVLFDPLDGSSNIDVNVPVGTIFSVLARPEGVSRDESKDILQSGVNQLASGYVLYGAATVLVYTVGTGVHLFTLDPDIGTFVLCMENLSIPESYKSYSTNEGNRHSFPDGIQRYLDWVQDEANGPYSARYVGSLVADFHRILYKGGVYLYPPTKKQPEGKLRLMYEASPMAFLAEQAGGKASDGSGRIMEIEPSSLHQRVPFYIGSSNEVDKVIEFVD